MPTIKDSAIAYEGKPKTKNISELSEVSTTLEISSRDIKGRDGTTFNLKTITVNGEEYRIPDSVIASLKIMLEDNPNLSKFKVRRKGTTMTDTEYTVIPLI